MAAWVLAAAMAWPVLMGAAVLQHGTTGPRTWSAAVYLLASRVCHQRPERSFHVRGVQWPVCGRCAGVYLGGAAMVPFAARRSRRLARRSRVALLVAAGAPTLVTIALEWGGVPVSNLVRAGTAWPLGAALLLVVVAGLGPGPANSIR